MFRLAEVPGVVATALCFALVAAGPVSAQTASEQKAAAEALFDRGLSLMREGNFAEACKQLEASQAIERGIGTMLYLAECYEKLGRTASAWALFREASSAADAAGQSDRAKAGAERAQELEPLLSTLTIEVAPENRVAGLEIQRNGVALPPGTWGVSVPVDPGRHIVTANAPGHEPWQYEYQVGVQAQETVYVPALAATAPRPAPPPAEPANVTATPVQAGPEAEPPELAGDDDGEGLRIAGWVTLGVGAVALGVGGVFGLQAISKNGDSEDLCPNPGPCSNREGVTLNEEAQDAATLSTVFVIGGAALVATGVILHLIAPSAEQPAVGLGLHSDGALLQLGGTL